MRLALIMIVEWRNEVDMIKLKQSDEGLGYFGINWALTNVCNYRCSYCHPDLHNGHIKPPSLERIYKFIDNAFNFCEARNIKPYFEFGGGEVTYLSWFSKVLVRINKRNGLVSIISNASSPLIWWDKNISMLHSVSLSFHYDQIKSQEQFIAVAKLVADSPSTRLQVNIMMLPSRFSECMTFAEKLREQINCGISLQPLYDGFGGGGISSRFGYSELQEKYMEKFCGNPATKYIPEPRGSLTVINEEGHERRVSSFELLVNQKTNFTGWYCNAGVENIVVTFEGDIYRAWCMQDEPIGNIYNETLNLPELPTLCHTKICQCGPDICSSKTRYVR